MPYIEVIQKYAEFEGRAKRTEFWLYMLIHNVIIAILAALSVFVADIFNVVAIVYALALLVPSLAVGCRRLHDSGKSGWLQLIWLVPLVGLIIMIVLFVLPSGEDNKYGARPE